MDLVAMGNFYMEEEDATNPYDQSEPYIGFNNKDKKNKYIQELDTNDEESITSDIYGEDDYWTIFENPIYDMSSEESVYYETYESCKEE